MRTWCEVRNFARHWHQPNQNRKSVSNSKSAFKTNGST